ncbi:MAG TPA: hypothetical protein VN372_14855 [Methanospirillum sp.]|nr:hypothetical protein [Methanospirillum sp.]
MTIKPIIQIQHEGVSALMKELGPVDTARFIRSFYQGCGNYTVERRGMFDKSMDDLVREMKVIEARNK